MSTTARMGILVGGGPAPAINSAISAATIEEKCRNMLMPLKGIPGVTVQSMDNIIGHQPYGVTLEVDRQVTGMSAHDVVDRLKQGDPPVWTRVREGDTGIILHAFGLNEGEDRVVSGRIAALFGR